jgi:hypothetical protein
MFLGETSFPLREGLKGIKVPFTVGSLYSRFPLPVVLTNPGKCIHNKDGKHA